MEYFRQREDEYLKEIANLKQQLAQIQQKINKTENKIISKTSNSSAEPPSYNTVFSSSSTTLYDCGRFIRKQVGSAEILHGLPLNNEYELIPFDHFSFTRVYPMQLGLGKRVVEKPIGYKRKDLLEALVKALDNLNKNLVIKAHINYNGSFILDDFIEGIYRNEPTTGTQYEMYFRGKGRARNEVIKITVMRPFAPLQAVQVS